MKKVNKKKAIALTLVAGIVTLSTAAFAGVMTSNGYGTYKDSIKKLLHEKNYTVNMEASYSVDGESVESSFVKQKLDLDGDVKLNMEQTSSNNPDYFSVNYYQDGKTISGYQNENTDVNYYVDDSEYAAQHGAQGMFNVTGNSDEKTIDKYINFAEKCADLLVGDLKNNFVLAGQEEGKYSYAIELSGMQIPEIINAGLSLICSENGRYSDLSDNEFEERAKNDPMLLLQEDVNVKNANCYLTVDQEGRLTENKLSFTVEGKDRFGNSHEMTMTLNAQVSDYGTTQPERVDLENLKGKVRYASTEKQERIAEIDRILENENLSENDRENYEAEKRSLERRSSGTTTVIGSADGETNVQVTY